MAVVYNWHPEQERFRKCRLAFFSLTLFLCLKILIDNAGEKNTIWIFGSSVQILFGWTVLGGLHLDKKKRVRWGSKDHFADLNCYMHYEKTAVVAWSCLWEGCRPHFQNNSIAWQSNPLEFPKGWTKRTRLVCDAEIRVENCVAVLRRRLKQKVWAGGGFFSDWKFIPKDVVLVSA
jgi:hypothetical protein